MNQNQPVSSGEILPVSPDIVPVSVQGVSGEGVAERYVAAELKKARATLRTTQIVTVLGLAALTLYLGYMTSRVVQYAQPEQAAEVATGLIAERVNVSAADMAEQFKTKIPGIIAQLPDHAIQKMPEVRQALVSRIETDLRSHAAQSSDEMGKHLDEFLATNKSQIQTVMEAGADRAALKSIGPALEQEMMAYLSIKPAKGGDSIRDSVNKSLKMLQTMKTETDRLTANKNLTLEQRKTRRAIAIIMGTVKRETGGINIQKAVLEGVDSLGSHKTLTGAVDAISGGDKSPAN